MGIPLFVSHCEYRDRYEPCPCSMYSSVHVHVFSRFCMKLQRSQGWGDVFVCFDNFVSVCEAPPRVSTEALVNSNMYMGHPTGGPTWAPYGLRGGPRAYQIWGCSSIFSVSPMYRHRHKDATKSFWPCRHHQYNTRGGYIYIYTYNTRE